MNKANDPIELKMVLLDPTRPTDCTLAFCVIKSLFNTVRYSCKPSRVVYDQFKLIGRELKMMSQQRTMEEMYKVGFLKEFPMLRT